MKEISLMNNAKGNLAWDMRTYMPYKGTQQRAEQLSLLSGLSHQRLVSERTLNLLNESSKNQGLTTVQKRNLELWNRQYDLASKLSEDLVKRISIQENITEKLWEKAKGKSDFAMVQPELEKLFDLIKEKATAYDPNKPMYDVLLDIYEKNITSEEISRYFSDLKKGVLNIIEKTKHIEFSSDILKVHIPIPQQKKLSQFIMKFLSIPDDRCRVDETEHPFTIGYADDVRITTHYLIDDPMASFYSVMHEAGHALYGLNLPEEHRWTAVGSSVSNGIHESQSRYIENFIGKNPFFLEYALPEIKKISNSFKNLSLDEFVKGVNSIEPSKIRIYADEVTYNLHIILIFEIERDLFAGKFSIADLPQVWNQKMEDYLGIEIKNDAEGVLQDVHWYGGSMGYFPDYALGNIYNGQMLDTMVKSIPDWNTQLQHGNPSEILNWIDNNVHKKGFLYDPADLIEEISGHRPDAKYFVKYMNSKFGQIYDLSF
jgi:carboxypeptidase Taq